jgi:hypothetical protein
VYRPDRGTGPVDTLAAMISEFNWWLLLLGLVVGGGLTWLVLSETRRREQDLEDDELPEEAEWLEARLAEEGQPLPLDTIARVVQLHREYLAIVPPSDGVDEWRPDELAGTSVEARTAGWDAPSAGSPEDDSPPQPPPERTATELTAPERPTPDEQGVRHEAGGG